MPIERAKTRSSIPGPFRPRSIAAPTRAGFTILELLIVVAIVLVLASLVLVGLNKATAAAQVSRTQTLMTSIRQGLVRFREDHGYLPPILDAQRDLLSPPDPDDAAFRDSVQDWFSVTTLADYLVGYGNHREDGYGIVGSEWDDETPPVGIRSPGPDGVWGATKFGWNGVLGRRMRDITDPSGSTPTSPLRRSALDSGQVFGPYIELGDDRLLASIDGTVNPTTGTLNTFFPGEANYDPDAPKVICDWWGSPIRYYRLPYPGLDPGVRFRATDRDFDGEPDPLPSLGDVFVLRPWDVNDNQSAFNRFNDDGPSADNISSRALEAAEFGLLSPGPDRSLDADSRVDVDLVNEDNIVELGP